MTLKDEKRQLRKKIRETLAGFSEEYLLEAGDRIQDQILASEEFARAKEIFLYLHMKGEPATDRILQEAFRLGKRVYIPKCYPQGKMDAVRISPKEKLTPAAYGILEPAMIAEVAVPTELDLVIVPCVCASADGKRLGHGGGYYDRFLPETKAITMCLCFDFLLTKEIPVDEHDLIMDYVITEKGFTKMR